MGIQSKLFPRLLPILIPSIQTCVLMATGDILAQTIVEKKGNEKYNLKRTCQFASIGLLFTGPSTAMWYIFLAKHLGEKGGATALRKVALDQLIFAPCALAVFLLTLGIVQQKGFSGGLNNIKNDYFDILLTNYKVWPMVQITNFYFVPLRHQVLLVQSVAVLWNTYLSWKTQHSKA